jgi:hypothetical protein
MNGGEDDVGAKYTASPLARHEKALKTAATLLLLEVAPETINYELRLQHGFTEGEAAAVIREAAHSLPRVERRRQPRHRSR